MSNNVTDQTVTICIIDDDPEDVFLFKHNLKQISSVEFIVIHFESWESVESEITDLEFDILFLDYIIGASVGIDVLKSFRGMNDQRPVVILTGQGDAQIAASLSREGADDYLSKDQLGAQTLFRVIRNSLERFEHRQEKAMLEEQLNHSHKMEAIGALTAGIAHDFNNMLQTISGYLELSMMVNENEEIDNNLKMITDVADQMAVTVKQLLTFGQQSYRTTAKSDMRDLLKSLIHIYVLPDPDQYSIDFVYDDEPLLMSLNPKIVQEVMLNILSNAVEAMPDGGEVKVTLSAVKDSNQALPLNESEYISVEISDNGCGIDPAVHARIFEPFYSTKEKCNEKGIGMGLAVAWQHVKKMKGLIHLESEPDCGSCFTIYLPRN